MSEDRPDGAWSPEKVAVVEAAFYSFAKHVRVNSKERGGNYQVARNFYLSQRRFFNAVFHKALANDKHTVKCLKSRQLGITTACEILDVFWLGYFDGIQGGLIYDTNAHRISGRDRIENIINHLPKWYKFPRIKTSNRDGIVLENGSRLVILSAGVRQTKSSGVLGRSEGLNYIHATEIRSWDNEEGLKSLQSSKSDFFENRLYLWESTASTYNDWYYMWSNVDELDEVTEFIGWWSKDDQRWPRGSPRYETYGVDPPSEEEQKRIDAVRERYDFEIDDEQLAWYRWFVDPTRERTEDDQEDSYLLSDQPFCVTADTRVGTHAGIKRIDQVCEGDKTALGDVLRAMPTGSARIWRAQTKLGYGLSGTANHPLITEDGREIELSAAVGERVRLQPPLFAENDYVVAWSEGIIRHSVPITPDFARLVGIFMGDGSISGYSKNTSFEFNIACDAQDRDLIDECHRLIRSVFGVNTQERTIIDERFVGAKGWTQIRCSSRLIYSTFLSLGLVRHDTVKSMRKVHVPEFIWRSPKHIVREFLSGLFEADGFNGGTAYRSELFSKWAKFLSDVQLLLLGFGITCRLTSRSSINGNGRPYQENKLQLRYLESKKFNEEIGFLSERKRAQGIEPPHTPLGRHRARIEFADEIVLVEDTGIDESVWNLTVSGQHWFDANGIVTHNTEDEAFQQAGSTFYRSDRLQQASAFATTVRSKSYRFWPGANITECDFQPARYVREMELTLWEEPVGDGVYIVAGDPAYGHDEANNNSCAEVLRCYADGLDQVCEYTSATIEPHHFAWLLMSLVSYYATPPQNDVMMICEINGPGEEVWRHYQQVRTIIRDGYLRAAARQVGLGNVAGNMANYVYTRSDSAHFGNSYMWRTTQQLKVQAMEGLRNNFHNGIVLLRSLPTLEEMKTITREGDKIAASGKGRDDRNFALAIGNRAWEERKRPNLIRQHRTREADRVKRSQSVIDRAELFNKNILQDFFAVKQRQRSQMRIASMQRSRW